MPVTMGSEAAAGGEGGSRRNPRQASSRAGGEDGGDGKTVAPWRGNGGQNRIVFWMALSVWANPVCSIFQATHRNELFVRVHKINLERDA